MCPPPVKLPFALALPALALGLVLFCAPAFAGTAAPAGGTCPQPPNALVITEFMTGPASAPHWVEIANPGKYPLSIDKVYLTVSDGSAKVAATKYNLGLAIPVLMAGESVAFGHVPSPSNPTDVWLKVKVLDLGEKFTLGACKGKLALEGPGGPIDVTSYQLCSSGKDIDEAVVWGLDPAMTDQCKNDTAVTWCQAVGDLAGTGTPGSVNVACDLDSDGFSSVQGDCSDQNGNVFPGAVEVCNGVDDDCNGVTDDNVVAPPGTCLGEGVCAGPNGDGLLKDATPVAKCSGYAGFVCTYPFGYESVTETLCDGFDNDCDGKTDEGLFNACGKCGPVPKEICNGVDDNCDGKTDETVALSGFSCGDTGVCLAATANCGPAGAPVCAQPLNWQATETWCDGLDNDCDGATDEELGLGGACSTGVGACAAAGVRQCGLDASVTCSGVARAPGIELCGDGLDNNCDGKTDEGFNVGEQCEAGQGICRVVGKRVCSTDHSQAICNVKPAAADSTERCGNGLDDNCNGLTDEAGCVAPSGAAAGCAAAGPSTGGAIWSLLSLIAVGILGWRRWRARREQPQRRSRPAGPATGK